MGILIIVGIAYIIQLWFVNNEISEDPKNKIISQKITFWILLIPSGFFILFAYELFLIIFRSVEQLIPSTKNKIKQIKEYYKQLK